MPQVSDFIGENTDIWNFNNLNIDFHPILPTYPEFNDESAKVQDLCKNHFLSKKSYSHIAHCTWNIVSSVRSSSGYHGLIEIRSSSANPLFQIFQILQIRK